MEQHIQKLGKKPVRFDYRTLRLENYLLLPVPPVKVDWTSKVAAYSMLGNDQVGDCVCACTGHQVEQWTTYAQPNPVMPTTDEALAMYEAVGGWNPQDPSTDNGVVMLDALNWWRKTGFLTGNQRHQITAFVSVDPQNMNHVKSAISIFGNIQLGLEMPLSAQGQDLWRIVGDGHTGDSAPGSWGGHCVPGVEYDNNMSVVSWGRLYRITWNFIRRYCSEAYAIISPDWLSSGRISPGGIALADLMADLNQISGQAAVRWQGTLR